MFQENAPSDGSPNRPLTQPELAAHAHNEQETMALVRRLTRSRRLANHAVRLLAAALIPVAALQTDITANKAELRQTAPVVHTAAEALDPLMSHSATIFIDGFGSKNSLWTAKHMAEPLQEIDPGVVFALEYDNAGIDEVTIAETIAETVTTYNETREPSSTIYSLTLYGYSIGGELAGRLAPILATEYGLTIDAVVFDHTPESGTAIRSGMRSQGDQLLTAIEAFHAVGVEIEYSTLARKAAELALADSNNIQHIRSSTKLLVDQYLVGLTADMSRNIKEIGELPGVAPTILYITSEKPTTDYMVDVAHSADTALRQAEEAGLPSLVIPVSDAVHSRLDLTLPEYVDALTKTRADRMAARELAVQDELDRIRDDQAFRRFGL